MVKRLVNIFNRASSALQKVIQMAENATTQIVGDKRPAEESVTVMKNENVKKKKKEHIVTLGKDEGFKRKVALLVAYNGAGYYGVQINRGFKTIESELFPALVEAGAVPQEHVDNTSKMWFQRGSRTDKGVSAVGQTFSLKISMVIVPDVVSKLNGHLPEQIRVLGYIRTTNGFDSKNFCCGRTYMYMTPTFAFAPLEKFITDEYRITEDRLGRVRSMLQMYVGTHKFHNFTSGVKYEQANASRYIINFECSEPYVREGIEFVTLRVRGQSFMLHQIRKMIGLTIAVLRGFCTEVAVTKSWEAERVDIPKAPGLGLVLEALHFDGYNKKFGSDGIHNPIDWTPQKDAMDDFKEKYIISDIVQQEKKDRVMLNWLQTLQFHNFDESRTEGPQKPWVRIEKLLLNKSKESESNPSSEDALETKPNVQEDRSSLRHEESQAQEANLNSDPKMGMVETVNMDSNPESEMAEKKDESQVTSSNSDFKTEMMKTMTGDSNLEAKVTEKNEDNSNLNMKTEIVTDGQEINAETSSTALDLIHEKEHKKIKIVK